MTAFQISTVLVYSQRCLVVTCLVPREIAAVSAHGLCTPFTHASVCSVTLFKARDVGCMSQCLAVTFHLHFWQNELDLLRVTAVTRGWIGYWNKTKKSWPRRRIWSRRPYLGLNPRPFDHESVALPLSYHHSPVWRQVLETRLVVWCRTWEARNTVRWRCCHVNAAAFNNGECVKMQHWMTTCSPRVNQSDVAINIK